MLHLNKLHRTICGCKVWYFPYRPTGMRCNYTQHFHGLAWIIPTALWYSFVLLCVRRRTSRHVDDLKWCNLYVYTYILYEWCGRGSRYGSKKSVRGIMNSSRRSTKGNCSFFNFLLDFFVNCSLYLVRNPLWHIPNRKPAFPRKFKSKTAHWCNRWQSAHFWPLTFDLNSMTDRQQAATYCYPICLFSLTANSIMRSCAEGQPWSNWHTDIQAVCKMVTY